MRRIANSASTGIALTNGDGGITFANPRLLDCFGVGRASELHAIEGPFEVDGAEIFGFGALLDHLACRPGRDVEFSFPGRSGTCVLIGRASTADGGEEADADGTIFDFVDISERALRETRERYYANHDALTGASNRVAFWVDLEEAVDRTGGSGTIALLCVDLDAFKPVNDTHGHDAGDEVLRQVVKRMKETTADRGSVYRFGGDEFAILLPLGDGAAEEAAAVAGAAIAAIERPVPIGGREVSVGASVGIALMPDDTESARTLVSLADAALYEAKNAGGGVRFFHDTVSEVSAVPRRAIPSA